MRWVEGQLVGRYKNGALIRIKLCPLILKLGFSLLFLL